MRKLAYHLASNFNWMRWALFVVTVSFTAVVGVYDYIDLATSVAITFSSFETAFVLLTAPASLAYIFMPVYLFIVCGLPNTHPLGAMEVLRHKSRWQWLGYKWLTLVAYTLAFFLALFAITFAIASQAFPYQDIWSTDFVNLQVSLGQAVANFTQPPLYTIGLSLLGTGLLYLFAGSVTMVCGLVSKSEPLCLACSMVVGLGVGAGSFYVWFVQKSMETQLCQGVLFATLTLVMVACSVPIVDRADFSFAKKG